jgi:hypothetical protein
MVAVCIFIGGGSLKNFHLLPREIKKSAIQ